MNDGHASTHHHQTHQLSKSRVWRAFGLQHGIGHAARYWVWYMRTACRTL